MHARAQVTEEAMDRAVGAVEDALRELSAAPASAQPTPAT
jgi:hypothetical protein